MPWRDPGQPVKLDTCQHWYDRRIAYLYANFGVTRKTAGDAVGWWGDYLHNAGDAHLSMSLHAAGMGVSRLGMGTGYVDHLRVDDATRKRENVDCKKFWRRFEHMLGELPEDFAKDEAAP
jgi:hypothetical protein